MVRARVRGRIRATTRGWARFRVRVKVRVMLRVRLRVGLRVRARRVLGGRGVGLLALHVVEDAEVVTLRPLLRPPAQPDRPLVLMRVVDRIAREGPQPLLLALAQRAELAAICGVDALVGVAVGDGVVRQRHLG